MQLACKSCGRSFDVDGEKVKDLRSARCLCGGLIALPTPAKTRQLGKYVLEERIAVGGMGEIWRAKMPGVEGFERQVAIKKMLPHLSLDRDFINMLVKEAKLTVLLHHPNIVQVFDLAREGEEYYIAMEYVPSVNLSTLLEYCANNGQFAPVALAVSVVMQALEGLSYAHTLKGADGEPMHILHRDVTPQNILVTREGWAKVTDFGIAKAKNEISTTRPGTIRGKLGYIAPEQLRSAEPDQRADIFCAGVVLWESLATRRLFKGTDEVDTLRMIVEARVPSLMTMRPDMTPELDGAVARALARDPDDRYTTAAEFKDALLDAIRPSTADDYQKLTREFLAESTDLFARRTPVEPEPETPTISIEADTADGTASITDLLLPPPRSGSRLGALITAVVLAGLVAGGWLFWKRGGERLLRVDSPVPLTTAEVQAAVNSASDQILACYSGRLPHDLEPRASLGVLPSGQIVDIAVVPSALGKATPCIANVLRGVQMRTHPGPRLDTTVRLPEPTAEATREAVPSEPTPPRATGEERAAKPLSPDEIQRTVRQYGTPIARCFSQIDVGSAPEQVNARIAILANGRVSSVELEPELGNAAANRCLVAAIKTMRFRASSKPVEVSLPLHLQRYQIK